MIIRHIYHSGVEILSEKYQLIIDYFEGDLELDRTRETIFLVSHGHDDHYTKKIHDFNKTVILYEGIDYRDKNTLALGPGDCLDYKDIKIKTSGSTDQGLSFEIELEGKKLIHVGDLNNWVWPEDTREERETMEKDFLNYLSVFSSQVDVLFFPVDYRLGENYCLGPDQAIEVLNPKLLLPLHFREHPEILPVYKRKLEDKVKVLLPQDTPYIL